MTPQEIFDTVARHLFTQGHPARDNDNDVCQYHAENGDKCAVGILIPPDIYISDFEGNNVTRLLDHYHDENVLPDFFFENGDLLEDLQNVHDGVSYWHTTNAMRFALERVARDHDLNAEILDTLTFGGR